MIRFEWDEPKGLWTLGERGLDFLDAIAMFDGRLTLNFPATFEGEDRFLTTAVLNGKFHTLIWTWRDGNRRIISFRRSRDGEEKRYRAIYG